MKYTIVLVDSTSHALRAEKVLQKEGIACKLIPVPRQLSSNCGVCVRVAHPDRARCLQVLHAAKAVFASVHDI